MSRAEGRGWRNRGHGARLVVIERNLRQPGLAPPVIRRMIGSPKNILEAPEIAGARPAVFVVRVEL